MEKENEKMAGRYPDYDFPCCYFYVNSSNEVVYVGKANCTLPERIDAHSKEEKFNYENTSYTIYYQKFSKESDMDVAEKVYIKSLKPILNVIDNTTGFFPTVNIDFSMMQIYDQTKQYQKVEKRQKNKKNEKEKIIIDADNDLTIELSIFDTLNNTLEKNQQLLYWAVNTKIEYVDAHTVKIILIIDDSPLSKEFYYDALQYLCFVEGVWDYECVAHILGTKFIPSKAIILAHLIDYNKFEDCIQNFIERYKKKVKDCEKAIEEEKKIIEEKENKEVLN